MLLNRRNLNFFWTTLPLLTAGLFLPMQARADLPSGAIRNGLSSLHNRPHHDDDANTQSQPDQSAKKSAVKSVQPAAVDSQNNDEIASVPKAKSAQKAGLQSDDMTLAEAADSFIGFEVTPIGPSSDAAAVTLKGTYYNVCAQGSSLSIQSGVKDRLGLIEMTDPDGKFRKCMKEHMAAGEKCTADNCSTLSSWGDKARLDLSKAGDVQVAFYHRDTNNREPNQTIHREDLDELPTAIRHVSPQTIADRAREAADEARNHEIARQNSIVTQCRRTSEELDQAESALGELMRIGAITEKQEVAKRKDLAKAKLKLIERSVDKSSGEDFDDLKSQLQAFSSDHGDQVVQVAGLYRKIALKQANAKGAGAQGLVDAEQTLKDAKDVIQSAAGSDGVSDAVVKASVARIDGYIADIEHQKLKLEALAAMQNPFSAMSFQSELGQKLQQDYQALSEACGSVMMAQSGMSGGMYGLSLGSDGFQTSSVTSSQPDMQACVDAQRAYSLDASAPREAQTMYQQQIQMQQRLSQMISGAMYGGGNNGMMGGVPNVAGPTGPALGMSGAPVGAGNMMSGATPYWGGGAYGNTVAGLTPFGGINPSMMGFH